MKATGSGAMQALSCAAFALLLLSAIFSVVALTGTWGSATFNVLGLLSGEGDFTLWDITVKPEISVIGISLTVPEMKKSIDASLCHDLDGLAKVDEACGKLHGIQIAVILGLVCAVLADLFASVAFASILAKCLRERVACAISMWLLLAAASALLTSLCAVVAIGLALSMPDSERFQDFASPGAGSICTGLLIFSSLLGMAFEIACWRSTRAHAREMPAGEKAEANKVAHAAEDVC